ncbi:MAG: Slp family lipoprotein [Deltaproteobacteria bacterium]|nr:Slp family lipoprotein [Deltaproteobacteria bacterium]
MKIKNILLFFLTAALLLAGCTSVIPRDVLSKVDEPVSIRDVQDHPDSFSASRVLWAGIILDIQNSKDHTIIEVLQKPSDYQGRPKAVDTSDGRFLARYNGFLDPAVYSEGREVTIAGELEGIKNLSIGEYAYTYPFVLVTEIHLWPLEPDKEYHYFHYPAYYHDRWRYW